MFRLKKLVQALQAAEVDFVIVGGVAMSAHGSAHVTQDLDVCYSRAPDNLERLVRALAPLKPRLRVESEPEGLPFLWDAETLRRGLNFTLMTHHGDVDLLGEVSGLGAYEEVRRSAEHIELFGKEIWVLGLPGLIASKQAAARPKDLRQIPELRALLALKEKERSERGGSPSN